MCLTITNMYSIVLLNLQGNVKIVSNSKTQCKKLDRMNGYPEFVNVHLIGFYYLAESLFHIYAYINCVFHLKQINKWYIKFEAYFLILNNTGINMLRDYSVIHLVDVMNNSDTNYGMVYNISTGTSQIAFSETESVVIYEYMNRIYMAQTMPPYLITCTDSFLNLSYPVERMLDVWINRDTVYVKHHAIRFTHIQHVFSLFHRFYQDSDHFGVIDRV